MLLATPAARFAALACLLPRGRLPLMMFPDAATPGDPSQFGGLSDDSPPETFDRSPVGFWSIYDTQAAMDASASAGAVIQPRSILSATIVLRADGQASRGSEFPGGEWEVVDMDGKRRLWLKLRNRVRKLERRYDGLVLMVQMPTEDEGEGEWQLQVVGTSSCWNVTNSDSPEQVGTQEPFSMLKMVVDRKKLVPTIKPFTRVLSREELEEEMQQQRQADREDEAELRQVLEDVRERKRRGTWVPPESDDRPDTEGEAQSVRFDA